MFGIPAGPKGLFYRFTQGYLLPSFTGGQVTTFRSADAEAAWTYMADLWAATAPASTNYEYMQEPLARGEVLVAWDHVARLVGATKDKPDDWLMVPAPRGPKGRGYMLVLAGLALPKGGLERPAAEQVIRGIAGAGMQVETLRQNAFFPVTSVPAPAGPARRHRRRGRRRRSAGREPRRDPLPPAGRARQPRRAGGPGVQGLLPGDLPQPPARAPGARRAGRTALGAARRREGAVLVPRPRRPGLRGRVMAAPTLDRDTEAPARRTRRARKGPSGLLLIAPSLVFMALLFGWPMVQGVLLAFRGDQGFTLEFVQRMVTDANFWPAVRNTLLLIVVLIPVQFAFAIAMALLLRAKPRLANVYFFVWAVPLAVSDLAAGLVWLAVLTDRGYLNSLLVGLGLPPVAWLAFDSWTSLFLAVLIAELWRATSLVLVIVVAGLQGIPRDYEEAAAVFGASPWRRLWTVILPLLRPSLQVALILRTILAFQTFAVARALTGENFPVLVGETYRWYVTLQDPGVAAALALVVLVLSMVTSVIYLRTLRSEDAR